LAGEFIHIADDTESLIGSAAHGIVLEMATTDEHLSDRAARARKIIDNPDQFKVCEGCESIVTTRVTTCPNCHGYRFDESAESVKEQAAVLASRPQQSVTSADME